MDAEYWLGLDVDYTKNSAVVTKTPKTIYKKLCKGNYWPSPTQDFLREKTKLTATGLNLVEQLKENNSELLKNALFVTKFCDQKSTDSILRFVRENDYLAQNEIDKCIAKKNPDRVALAFRLFDKNPEILIDLYWAYLISRRDFDPYWLGHKEKEFFTFVKSDLPSFQAQIQGVMLPLNKDCYCWHIFAKNTENIFCMRAFPKDRIIHQVRRNSTVSSAGTSILKILSDGSIEVPASGRRGTLGIAKALAAKRFGKKVKFVRQFNTTDSSKLSSMANNLAVGPLPSGLKILEVEFKRFPVPGHPTVRLKREGGLEETLQNMDRLGVDDISSEAQNISEVVISIDERCRAIAFLPQTGNKVVAICHNRLMSSEDRALLKKYFISLGIKLNFGSEKID